jgi:hypothetical protein
MDLPTDHSIPGTRIIPIKRSQGLAFNVILLLNWSFRTLLSLKSILKLKDFAPPSFHVSPYLRSKSQSSNFGIWGNLTSKGPLLHPMYNPSKNYLAHHAVHQATHNGELWSKRVESARLAIRLAGRVLT